MGRIVKNLGLYLILILLVVSVVNMFLTPEQVQKPYNEVSYSSFLFEMEGGRVSNLQIRNNTLPGESSSAVLRGELKDGTRFLAWRSRPRRRGRSSPSRRRRRRRGG